MDDELNYSTNHECIVNGCGNRSNEGSFVGEFCYPCYKMIKSGDISHNIHADNFISKMYRENQVLLKNSNNENIKMSLENSKLENRYLRKVRFRWLNNIGKV